jgi:hypothetical protein
MEGIVIDLPTMEAVLRTEKFSLFSRTSVVSWPIATLEVIAVLGDALAAGDGEAERSGSATALFRFACRAVNA